MKKLAIILAISLFSFSVGKAQDRTAERGNSPDPGNEIKPENKSEVNVAALRNFDADFADVSDADWKRSENFDEATFSSNGKTMTAYYDFDGNLVGTTSSRVFADLPEKGQQEIREKYKDYTIGPVLFFDDNAMNDAAMVLWATSFSDEDLYFVELNSGTKKIIVDVSPTGNVKFFKQLQ